MPIDIILSAIMLSVVILSEVVLATGTAISCSQGRQYGPQFSLTFLDVYGHTSYVKASLTKPGAAWYDLLACSLSWAM
jgi:hypothetical protein